MRKYCLIFAVLFFAVIVSGGTKVRVVSLSPAITEMICAINGADVLVGRSRACNYPQEVTVLPVAGDLGNPNTECVSRLRADIVVSDMDNPAADWDRLRKMGVKVVLLKSNSISQYRENILTIGKLIGKESEAELEWKRFSKKMQLLEASSKKLRKLTCVVFLGINPLVSCNDSTFVGEVLAKAGVINITGNLKQYYFVLSPEFVLEKNPETAVLTGMAGDFRKRLSEIPLLRNVKFMRNNSIVDTVPADMLCRLSPRTPLAVELLIKAFEKYRITPVKR